MCEEGVSTIQSPRWMDSEMFYCMYIINLQSEWRTAISGHTGLQNNWTRSNVVTLLVRLVIHLAFNTQNLPLWWSFIGVQNWKVIFVFLPIMFYLHFPTTVQTHMFPPWWSFIWCSRLKSWLFLHNKNPLTVWFVVESIWLTKPKVCVYATSLLIHVATETEKLYLPFQTLYM